MFNDIKDKKTYPTQTKVTRLYSGDDGESHFQDIYIETPNQSGIGGISEQMDCKGFYMRTMPHDYVVGFHNSDRRQFLVVIQGAIEMSVANGEKRIFNVGDIILCEDKTGNGHTSRGVGPDDRISLFLPLE